MRWQDTFVFDHIFPALALLLVTYYSACLGYYCVKSLFTKKFGLLLNAQGFVHNWDGFSLGPVSWAEVTDIFEVDQKIYIRVTDPEKYLKKGSLAVRFFFAKRIALKKKLQIQGTPICVSAASLGVEHSKLLSVLRQYLSASRQGMSSEKTI